jgi:hypothetical protein
MNIVIKTPMYIHLNDKLYLCAGTTNKNSIDPTMKELSNHGLNHSDIHISYDDTGYHVYIREAVWTLRISSIISSIRESKNTK